MRIPFILIEVFFLLFFLGFIGYLSKKKRSDIKLVLSLLIYALIFENLNVMLSQGSVGGYSYEKSFLLIFDVPLFIILSWAMIIYSSIKITDSLSVKESTKPFLDALLTVLVDLSIDVPAIRLGFWKWDGYLLNEGFFGVPGNNFIGWLLVSFCFCFLWRRYSNRIGFLTGPLSYLLYLTVFLLFIKPFQEFLGVTKSGEVFIFFLLSFLFVAILLIKNRKIRSISKADPIVYMIRAPFFLFGIFSVILFGFYRESLVILFSSILWLALELALFLKGNFLKGKNER